MTFVAYQTTWSSSPYFYVDENNLNQMYFDLPPTQLLARWPLYTHSAYEWNAECVMGGEKTWWTRPFLILKGERDVRFASRALALAVVSLAI